MVDVGHGRTASRVSWRNNHHHRALQRRRSARRGREMWERGEEDESDLSRDDVGRCEDFDGHSIVFNSSASFLRLVVESISILHRVRQTQVVMFSVLLDASWARRC